MGTAACSGAPPQRRTLVCIPHLRCSGGSASRPSSWRRPAPFGAAPRPSGSPSPSSPPACARSASAATRPPATRTPPTRSSAARRRRRGAALCRPALLDGAAQPLQAEAGGRVLLVDPLAPGVLRGRGADLQAGWPRRELRAGEAAARGAADGRELKAGGEGGEDQESRRGRGCGACMWR